MKKLNEVEIFVKMLEHSDEVFRVVPIAAHKENTESSIIYHEEETHVKFQKRNIIFIFDKDGKFLRIKALK